MSEAPMSPLPHFLHTKKPVQSVTPDQAFERHYTVLEIAKMWSLSEHTIRRIFHNEEGVVNWGRADNRRKRHYLTLRIPESVMLRVYQRIRKAS